MHLPGKPHLPKRDEQVERELAFHVDALADTYEAQGMPAAEARRQALIDFGGHEQVRQQVREIYRSPFYDAVRFHLQAAWRFVRRSPSLAAAIMLTLALGIGANGAVFLLLHAVILRPLPYPHADRLLVLSQEDVHARDANRFVAPPRLEDWNRLATAFQGISGSYLEDVSELSGALPERLSLATVAPRFLRVLDVVPLLGRDFTPQEEHFGGPQAALISYRFWQRRFGGNPQVLGQRLRVGEAHYTVVGVMPQDFLYPNRDVDLWTPSPADAPFARSRESTWYTAIGRMRPGLTEATAMANLATVQAQLGRLYPKTDADLRVSSVPLKRTVVGTIGSSLWVLYGAVTLLLLIACSNIAALLLARMADREHEIAIRFSLGASRAAIQLQLLTEVLALALAGSLFGLGLAVLATRAFHTLAATLPRADEITLRWPVVLYLLGCAFATTLLCGLYPALRGTRRQLAASLAQSDRTHTGARNPTQSLLVGVQVMLAVVLLTGAGLLLRSFQELHRVPLGFEPTHVLTFQVSGSWAETVQRGALEQRISRTLDALRALPGVQGAATAALLPGATAKYQIPFLLDGHTSLDHPILADNRFVSSGYFHTLGIPVLAGEACTSNAAPSQLVVNQSFARRYLAGSPALGHALREASGSPYGTAGLIGGIVADAHEQGVAVPPLPTVYTCYNAPTPFPVYLLRTSGDPLALAAAVRQTVRRLEPERSVYAIESLQSTLNSAFAEDRLRTLTMLSFALTAIALAAIGLYGTLSYTARTRQRELSLRLVLGATRAEVARRFILQGLRVTAIGSLAGCLLSLAEGRLLASMLYGVSAQDPLTFGIVLLLVALVALVASAVPARRAAQTEPAEALRAG